MRSLFSLLITVTLLAQSVVAETVPPGYTRTPGGAWYIEILQGEGKPAVVGELATIHFRGWLDNNGSKGKKFVDSRLENHPISFVIGTEKVMPGWNEGVIGMRKGGRRLVGIPPALGLGDRGFEDVVPPGASILFQIDLVDLRRAGESPSP